MTLALALLMSAVSADARPEPTNLPTRFAADRVYVAFRNTEGDKVQLFTDTGGGSFITRQMVEFLGLKTFPATDPDALRELGKDAAVTDLPAQDPLFWIPPLHGEHPLAVVPKATPFTGWPYEEHGMLGQKWFRDRIWTWNYQDERLTLEPARWRPDRKLARVPLGFKTRADGKRDNDFPRITIRIDGTPIDVLLDTGATTLLTPKAMEVLKDGISPARATSMISDTVFQGWHKAHPEWRVIEDAQVDTHAAMIEVPSVEIAGMAVGPVWFTWRPDANFHDYMSGMMDKPVEGAIGGNALRNLEMTLDYPRATAWFKCVSAVCGAKAPPAH